LGKIAESLAKSGFYHWITNDDDMTKVEDKTYNNMSEKDLVKIKRIGDTTYVTIKEKGEDLSRKLLDK
jgi:PDZ domain-containing secreted protein